MAAGTLMTAPLARPPRATPALLLAVVGALSAQAVEVAPEDQPNPPVWPGSVRVFSPEDNSADIQSAVDAAHQLNGGQGNNGEFSPHRFAFLFKPGQYDVDVPVGYYTQVAGLGRSPEDVVFASEKGVYCEEGSHDQGRGALTTFWRVAENFKSDAFFDWFGGLKGMLWATSQAAPLRRLVVSGDLILFQYTEGEAAGYASGGFIANSNLLGHVAYGSQQQYFTRNSALGSADGGVWNMVFVGTQGAPPTACGAGAAETPVQHPVAIAEAPKVAEKPFIVAGTDGKFALIIPGVQVSRVGFDWSAEAREVPFESVFVADPEKDNADTINAKLAQGLHVVLAPGLYHLSSPLELNIADQVLLGLGLATLVVMKGTAAVRVGDVAGVRVAGVLLQAGPEQTDALLEWGSPGFPGDPANPGFLHDVFARVGGPAEPAVQRASTMVRINSGHVIGDNLWLWRADHTETGEVKGSANPCQVALEVEGDDVTMYGLATEHALGDQVRWNGDRGATYFFQSELPYDVAEDYGQKGYAGYRVGDKVREHQAFGVGVYHYFRDFPVEVEAGIVAPAHVLASIVSPVTVALNGQGTLRHVLNNLGADTSKDAAGGIVQWLCPADVEGKTVIVPVDPGGPARGPAQEALSTPTTQTSEPLRSTAPASSSEAPTTPSPGAEAAEAGGTRQRPWQPQSPQGEGSHHVKFLSQPGTQSETSSVSTVWLRSSSNADRTRLSTEATGNGARGIDWDLGKIYLGACVGGVVLGALFLPFRHHAGGLCKGGVCVAADDAVDDCDSGLPSRSTSNVRAWLRAENIGESGSLASLLERQPANDAPLGGMELLRSDRSQTPSSPKSPAAKWLG